MRFKVFKKDREDLPLHRAVIANNAEEAAVLLHLGADRQMKDERGFTALQLARYLNRKEVLNLFSDTPKGAIQICDERGAAVLCDFAQFNKLMGVEYASHLIFGELEFLYKVSASVKRYPLDSRVSIERRWLGALYQPCIDGSCLPAVSIRYIDQQLGYGLFAEQNFAKGEFIGEYTGEVKRRLPCSKWVNSYVGEYALGGSDPVRFVIDAKKTGNYTRYINHSDAPNASAVTVITEGLLHVILYAEEKISSGEEITFDYGPKFWRWRKKKKRVCAS